MEDRKLPLLDLKSAPSSCFVPPTVPPRSARLPPFQSSALLGRKPFIQSSVPGFLNVAAKYPVRPSLEDFTTPRFSSRQRPAWKVGNNSLLLDFDIYSGPSLADKVAEVVATEATKQKSRAKRIKRERERKRQEEEEEEQQQEQHLESNARRWRKPEVGGPRPPQGRFSLLGSSGASMTSGRTHVFDGGAQNDGFLSMMERGAQKGGGGGGGRDRKGFLRWSTKKKNLKRDRKGAGSNLIVTPMI